MTWLLHYVGKAWSLLTCTLPNPPATTKEGEAKATEATRATRSAQSTCLICEKSFTRRSSLTTHSRGKHKFEQPFPCPQCYRDGLEPVMISSSVEWSTHVEDVHGKNNAPTLAKADRPGEVEASGRRPQSKTAGVKRARDDDITEPRILEFDLSTEPLRKEPCAQLDDDFGTMWHDPEIPSFSSYPVPEITGYGPYFNLGGGCESTGSDFSSDSSDSSDSGSCGSFSTISSEDTDTPLEWPESCISTAEIDTTPLADTEHWDCLSVHDTDDAGWEWGAFDHELDGMAGNRVDV